MFRLLLRLALHTEHTRRCLQNNMECEYNYICWEQDMLQQGASGLHTGTLLKTQYVCWTHSCTSRGALAMYCIRRQWLACAKLSRFYNQLRMLPVGLRILHALNWVAGACSSVIAAPMMTLSLVNFMNWWKCFYTNNRSLTFCSTALLQQIITQSH